MKPWLVTLAVLLTSLLLLVAFLAIRRLRQRTRNHLDLLLTFTAVVVGVASLVVSVVAVLQDRAPAATDAESGAGDIRGNGDVNVEADDLNGVCIYVLGDCPNSIVDPEELSLMPVQEAASLLRQLPGSDLPPVMSADPPVYVVLGTNEQGLFIRDGVKVDDHRLPGEPVIMDARPIYVDCKVDGAWLADPAAPNKAQLQTWLKIRHPEPGDTGSFFVYGGYAFPVGHNGDVPLCTN